MKHVIWSNETTEELYESEKEMYLEDNPDAEEDDELIWELVYESIANSLEDEKINLNEEVTGEIFLVGTIQRWNGAFSAYKGLNTKNVGEALRNAVTSFDGNDHIEIFVEDGKMMLHQYGHDNPVSPSVLEFRAVNGYDTLESLVYAEDDTTDILLAKSQPIAQVACDVYGWDMAA